MPDTVLFDLFGVIAREQSPAGQELLVATAAVPGLEFWEAYWALRVSYDRGEVTGDEYWRQVASTLGTTFDNQRIARLIAADVASWSAVDDEMVALVEQTAAAGRQLALVSNIPEELAVHYEQHHRWLAHFDLVAFSCRIGHAKPEPEAYLWCCRALGLAPDRILFVDDRPENIHAAAALGMHTHLFAGSAPARQAVAGLDTVPQR
ncbi:HAD family phosphatase [Micromonospora sp. 15K316]|uniref:HAD family hydrolase n=1 Tax=Micromonospora sp. 15K316 TaxID=2530376 RepID=UPI001050A864|nr:HAD family phosphatase [Micromonospora sp. 15K316]TDC38810.1 HAD family phosphatase [Micromonospora sp. 15K316]